MKNLLIILLIATSLQLKAGMTEQNTLRRVALYSYFIAVPVFCASDYYWTFPDRTNDGIYVSGGLDGKMAFDGLVDSRWKLFAHYAKKFETAIILECFGQMQYQGWSLAQDYCITNRKFSVIAGIEGTRIWNYNGAKQSKVWSYGANAELRYIINRKLSISYIGNLKTRPELQYKKAVYSGYIQLNYKIL